MATHRLLARWTGYCASCHEEAPLLLVSEGPHGVRAWLSGAGPEDRALSYTCGICGRVEHVPATETEDAVYDATLPRWPDWVEVVVEPVMVQAPAPVELVAPVDVPVRLGVVRVVTLPVQRGTATDLLVPAA